MNTLFVCYVCSCVHVKVVLSLSDAMMELLRAASPLMCPFVHHDLEHIHIRFFYLHVSGRVSAIMIKIRNTHANKKETYILHS